MLRHVRPRSRWADGFPGAIRRTVGSRADNLWPVCILATMIWTAMVVYIGLPGLSSGFLVTIAMILITAMNLSLALTASYLVYSEAEKHSDAIHREGVEMVTSDVGKGVDGSMLFMTSESMDAWNSFIATAAPADVRHATMRLAALLSLKKGGGDEPDQRFETARAAEAVLSSVRRLQPPAVPRASREDDRMMARILGGDAPMARTVSTGDAHADEIAFIAQEALATDPDLVDRNGCRIDRLLRIDLPELVAERNAALRHASEAGTASALADYAHGIATIERSVAEALGAWQAARADALATRVRFLSQRRGEEFRRSPGIPETDLDVPHRRDSENGIMATIGRMIPRTRNRA